MGHRDSKFDRRFSSTALEIRAFSRPEPPSLISTLDAEEEKGNPLSPLRLVVFRRYLARSLVEIPPRIASAIISIRQCRAFVCLVAGRYHDLCLLGMQETASLFMGVQCG